MTWFDNLLRRARLRGLKEGLVQAARAESLENDAKDAAERWQDYGFAANPVDGQGLVLHVAGHTIIVRMDRLAERPQLAAHEVCVWHKEGHRVTLRAGRLVEVTCDQLTVHASAQVTLNTPLVQVTGSVVAGGDVADAGGSKTMAGMCADYDVHTHDSPGGTTDAPDPSM